MSSTPYAYDLRPSIPLKWRGLRGLGVREKDSLAADLRHRRELGLALERWLDLVQVGLPRDGHELRRDRRDDGRDEADHPDLWAETTGTRIRAL